MGTHVKGLDLARQFYSDSVEALIAVPHAAALLGEGSEVLGYDQKRSTDHSWGPRLQIFVQPADVVAVSDAVESGLPSQFQGYPVQFYCWQTATVRHHVLVTTAEQWLAAQLRVNHPAELTPAKWLTIPQQHLLQCTAGAVFRDDLGTLSAVRDQLSWYPADVWLWMMAAQWHLIANTQHFLGRTAEAMDPRGSTLIAWRLARLMMELSFLQERTYWPYLKWFGTAFAHLRIGEVMGAIVDGILAGNDYQTREQEINRGLMILAEGHNSLGLTQCVVPVIRDYGVGINNAIRPYPVLNAGEFATACQNAIVDEALRSVPLIGSIDQLTHGDDLLINFTSSAEKLEILYGPTM